MHEVPRVTLTVVLQQEGYLLIRQMVLKPVLSRRLFHTCSERERSHEAKWFYGGFFFQP